jgi:endonuclease-3
MPNPAKTRLIQKIVPLLRKQYDSPKRRESLPVLEHLIMAVLADGTTTDKADAVFARLKSNYFDWNEVRVSAVAELQEALSELPDPEQRAARLKSCLKYIFETNYSFDLEHYRKLPMKEVARLLSKMPVASDALIARVVRDGLGGTAMPLDSAATRVLTRLELIDHKTTADMLSGSLARMIPRARSFEFCHLLSELGADTCLETEPRCKHCCLLDVCITGQRNMAAAKAAAEAAGKRSRSKAKPSRSRAH